MLSLSPTSEAASYHDDVDDDDHDDDGDAAAYGEHVASGNDHHDDIDMASKLAFTFDSSNLDDEGKPRNKLARKSLSRNESEKLRRDRLNAYIAELAKLVPLIMSTNRKLDKASVLRLTVTYLRIYHDLIKSGHSDMKWKPDFLTYENLGNVMLESIGGFLLVINQRGTLIFATEDLTSSLGHCLVDVLGHSIFKIIHSDDEQILKDQFKEFNPTTNGGEPAPAAHRSCILRMLIKSTKPALRYERVQIIGHLKSVPSQRLGPSLSSHSEPEICLIGVGRVLSRQPINELQPAPDNNPNMWITRHELDGKITFSDQRGALLTGFLPGESIGVSAYSLVHPEDIGSVVALHNMFLTTSAIPKTVFRMFTKARDILYIETNTHMVVDMWSSKPKYIISINKVLSAEKGEESLQHQKMTTMLAVASPASPSSGSLSDADSDHGSTGELLDGLVIPEIKAIGNLAQVIVGNEQYEIHLTPCDVKSPGKASPSQAIFDANVHTDDAGQSIPLVKPVFLGMGEEEPNSGHSQYDQINTFLGNDPIPGIPESVGRLPNSSMNEFSGRPPGGDPSPLHNLQSMVSNNASSHTMMGPPPAPPPITHYTQNYTAEHHLPQNQYTPGNVGQPRYIPRVGLHGPLYLPSTAAKQNSRLIDLLNKKRDDHHVRETNTSHFVQDILGHTSEELSQLRKRLPDLDQLSETQTTGDADTVNADSIDQIELNDFLSVKDQSTDSFNDNADDILEILPSIQQSTSQPGMVPQPGTSVSNSSHLFNETFPYNDSTADTNSMINSLRQPPSSQSVRDQVSASKRLEGRTVHNMYNGQPSTMHHSLDHPTRNQHPQSNSALAQNSVGDCQTSLGQITNGHHSLERNVLGRNPLGQRSAGHASLSQTSFGKDSLDQYVTESCASLAPATSGLVSHGHDLRRQVSASQTLSSQSAYDQSLLYSNGQPSVREKTVEEQILEQVGSLSSPEVNNSWTGSNHLGGSHSYKEDFGTLKHLKEVEERKKSLEDALTSLKRGYVRDMQQFSPVLSGVSDYQQTPPSPGPADLQDWKGCGDPQPITQSVCSRRSTHVSSVDSPTPSPSHSGLPAYYSDSPSPGCNTLNTQVSTETNAALCHDFDDIDLGQLCGGEQQPLVQQTDIEKYLSDLPEGISDQGVSQIHNGSRPSSTPQQHLSSPITTGKCIPISPTHQEVTSTSEDYQLPVHQSPSSPASQAGLQSVLLSLVQRPPGDDLSPQRTERAHLVSTIMKDSSLVQDLLEQYISKSLSTTHTQ